jgi:hypothetical protein
MKRTLPSLRVSLAGLVACLLLASCSNQAVTVPPPVPPGPAPAGFQRGITLTAYEQNTYRTAETRQSLEALAETGANWVGIIVIGYQRTRMDTTIDRTGENTPTDADLRAIIAEARRLGLKVMLKPLVDLSDDAGHWRGDIGDGFTDAQWPQWFAAYTDFITHYAALAKAEKIDLFCVGTEFQGTTTREADWRAVVAAARKAYDGPITYCANWSDEEISIRWWDAVDYIGVDAYYPLTTKDHPTVEELRAAWVRRGWVKRLEDLNTRWKKPIILTELGFRSVVGANREPWVWDTNVVPDPQGQADAYRATLETFWAKPWLAGMFWWSWEDDPKAGGPTDTRYTPRAKPAETVLHEYYTKPE